MESSEYYNLHVDLRFRCNSRTGQIQSDTGTDIISIHQVA